MLTIWVDHSANRLKLQTDDSSVRYLLEGIIEEFKFSIFAKRKINMRTTVKLYDEKRVSAVNGVYTFTLGLGYIPYVINVFKNFISVDDYNEAVKTLVAESYRTIPFPELRDYQNDDVLHLLKYRRGLLGCYTSYGKTQVIATLANYFYEMGEKVLLVTPNKKPNEELVKRCKSAFNLKVPSDDGRIQGIITAGLLNRNDIKNPDTFKQIEDEWKTFTVVLVDEAEYTINPGGMFLYDHLTGADRFYGFSGTADKIGGECITFMNGLSEVILRNKDLVKYFGANTVFRKPITLDIDNIVVKTGALERVQFEKSDFGEKTNVYLNVMTRIWTNPDVCRMLVKVGKRFPMTYIPMNNLANILSHWIENYFIGVFRILLISFEGYTYYDLNGNVTVLNDLNEACEYIKNGLVDIIPSTSSGFRALDLPGLENICLVQGKVAGVTLQCVGRVARGSHMNVISFDTLTGRKIPVYSNGLKERDTMLHEYYKYCKIVDSEIYEDKL